MNFRNIRIYGHEYEPEFFRSTGVRGWWVRVLNRVRLSLELRCQFHAMLILGQKMGVDIERLGRQVRHDQAKIVDYIRQSKEFAALTTTTRVSEEAENISEKTSKTLARLTAQGRARRYRRARGTFPIYEAEAYTHGPEERHTERTAESSENREH